MASTSSQLSGLGNGSSLVVDLEFPEEINHFAVSGKTISLFLNSGPGLQEYYAESKLDLNSINLSSNSGIHTVKVSLFKGKVDFAEVK